jgi:hypothetical protein
MMVQKASVDTLNANATSMLSDSGVYNPDCEVHQATLAPAEEL